jgi:hypothetical protein
MGRASRAGTGSHFSSPLLPLYPVPSLGLEAITDETMFTIYWSLRGGSFLGYSGGAYYVPITNSS